MTCAVILYIITQCSPKEYLVTPAKETTSEGNSYFLIGKCGINFWNCLKSMDIERQCYLIHFLISRQPSDQIQGGTVYYIIFFLGKLELNFMLCNRGVFHGSC